MFVIMEDPTPVAQSPQKRSLEEDEPTVTTPVRQIRSEASSPLSVISIKTPSPLKANDPNSTASIDNQTLCSVPTPSSAQQPAKRRKLTSQEKEAQRLEKEAKAKAREEKKAQKEADERLKAEQKAQRDEEKRKKNEEQDEKKRLKEEKQQRLEEEKAKKARSQMKLNAFFVKPQAGSSPGQAVVASSQNPAASPISLPSRTGANTNLTPPSPQKAIVKNAQSDYARYFLPFNVPPHTILAPKNTFLEDPERMEAARARLEGIIAKKDTQSEPITPSNVISAFPKCNRHGHKTVTIAEIVELVNNSSDGPIDLAVGKCKTSRHPLELLKDIPMKVSKLNDGSDAICTDFKNFTMGFLLDPQMRSIDPFATSYWGPDPATAVSVATVTKKDGPASGVMNPPRVPLTQRTMNGMLNTFNTPQNPPVTTPGKPSKAKRMVPPEQLPAFKAEVEGKDLTKLGMVEALKKAFPKLPKDAITNTLSVVAARVGPTEKEKRWVLINT
ncbi:chromatin assembly factor 1 subunit a [Pyrenophora seminiperda CCB06]|uniref:Chromatin assembly factor 1 subunit a n=1 Tax=Pyrenophora seminiperda CCB06 TaxID=1302712 RepID=A0A3M7M0R1_9PLEO|nr:chromatin assembly factor 1 subunit a [Pyrenophora seminiperda CCB06]